MTEQLLSKNWTLTILGDNVYHIGADPLPASIPGSVYSCLLENKRMPDPYWRDNELDALKLMENDFIFSEVFVPEKDILESDRIILRFDGIDTIADIALNGEFLAHTENMHRSFEYDVKGVVKPGENELKVTFYSPTKFIAAAHEQIGNMESSDAMPGYPQLRKAHCMFGWDWGPRLPDAGFYRPIRLLGVRYARLSNDIRIWQEHTVTETGACGNEVSRVMLTVTARTDSEKGGRTHGGEVCVSGTNGSCLHADEVFAPGTHLEAVLTTPQGEELSFASKGILDGAAVMELQVRDPQLWWPNGYGKQPLYTVKISLVLDATGDVLDCATRRIGLRTVTVDTSPVPNEERDPHIGPQVRRDRKEGRRFNFVVNGLPIFAMGGDYIPEDNILQRVNRQRTAALLRDAADAHYNSIRIWGGGYYLDDFFYDLCDEYGLLVWQDFMFACASYELNDEFERNLRAEFVEVVRRIRHHASLGLWCGNNEMETEILEDHWEGEFNGILPGTQGIAPVHKASNKQFYDYIKLYEYILPQVMKKEAPEAFYWPSSPSSGGNYEDAYEENIGDAHYWGVWHGGDQFSDYRKHHFRFLSEFGFQSFPCMATVRSFTEPQDRNVFSEIMEMHQRNTAANGKIMNYLSATYRYPRDFDQLLYCSQMLQLDAIRYGVEYFRRIRGTCMGTMVWQLNDIWPVASWSSIDYYGRWKALHYGEKRFFAPVSITCEEHGRLDQKPFVNSLPIPVEYSAALHVANETGKVMRGTVNWRLCRPDSSVLKEGTQQVSVEPYSGAWLEKEMFNGAADEREMHLYYELRQAEEVVSSGTALFVAPKHYRFADPKLRVRTEGSCVVVTSEAYAKGVCVETEDGNLRLSDNFFDMEKGERRLEILSEIPSGTIRVRSVYDIA